MSLGDFQFMKEIGIEPFGLHDPLPSPPPSPPPSEVPILKLAERDSRWLQDLRVAWEHEPVPEFIPPKTMHEYLTRFPTGINEATRAVAKELGISLPDGGLDDLSQEITQMFLDFAAADLEDVVAMYVTFRPIRPGGFSFPDYMRFRVKACVETVLQNRMTDTDNIGESR